MRKLNKSEVTIARLWNAGLERQEAVQVAGETAGTLFDEFEADYDGACIPRNMFPDYREPAANTDPEYLAWKGVIGPGAQLRAMC